MTAYNIYDRPEERNGIEYHLLHCPHGQLTHNQSAGNHCSSAAKPMVRGINIHLSDKNGSANPPIKAVQTRQRTDHVQKTEDNLTDVRVQAWVDGAENGCTIVLY